MRHADSDRTQLARPRILVSGEARASALSAWFQQAGVAASRVVETRPPLRFAWALRREITDDDVFGMAAEMAYRFLFAVFPLLLFLVASLGFAGEALGLDDVAVALMDELRPLLPAEVSKIFEAYVMGLLSTRSSAFLTVGVIGTLWGAAGGVSTLIKGLNRAYDVERSRPFWRRQSIAVAVTATLPPTAVTFFGLALAGRAVAEWLATATTLGPVVANVVDVVRWPIIVVAMFGGLSLIYHVLPATNHRYIWSLPGSAFATGGWIVLTQLFGLYMANVADYGATYGGFGTIIAFLLWLYLVSVVVLLGAEINALLEPTQRKYWRAAELASSRGPGDLAESRREG